MQHKKKYIVHIMSLIKILKKTRGSHEPVVSQQIFYLVVFRYVDIKFEIY